MTLFDAIVRLCDFRELIFSRPSGLLASAKIHCSFSHDSFVSRIINKSRARLVSAWKRRAPCRGVVPQHLGSTHRRRWVFIDRPSGNAIGREKCLWQCFPLEGISRRRRGGYPPSALAITSIVPRYEYGCPLARCLSTSIPIIWHYDY